MKKSELKQKHSTNNNTAKYQLKAFEKLKPINNFSNDFNNSKHLSNTQKLIFLGLSIMLLSEAAIATGQEIKARKTSQYKSDYSHKLEQKNIPTQQATIDHGASKIAITDKMPNDLQKGNIDPGTFCFKENEQSPFSKVVCLSNNPDRISNSIRDANKLQEHINNLYKPVDYNKFLNLFEDNNELKISYLYLKSIESTDPIMAIALAHMAIIKFGIHTSLDVIYKNALVAESYMARSTKIAVIHTNSAAYRKAVENTVKDNNMDCYLNYLKKVIESTGDYKFDVEKVKKVYAECENFNNKISSSNYECNKSYKQAEEIAALCLRNVNGSEHEERRCLDKLNDAAINVENCGNDVRNSCVPDYQPPSKYTCLQNLRQNWFEIGSADNDEGNNLAGEFAQEHLFI